MAHIFANNVAGTLAANIGPSDTLILLGAGQGAAFPAPTGGDYYYATLTHITTGVVEIVRVTARTADTLTVERGRDGTSATSFTTGSLIELRLVAQALRDLDYSSARGSANGLASLDSGGRVPTAQLPANVVYSTGGKIAASLIPNEYVVDDDLNAYVAKNSVAALDALTVGSIVVGAGTDPVLLYQTGSGALGVRSGSSSSYKYFSFGADGNLYVPNGTVKIGSQDVWHAGNFNPASYMPLSGGSISGNLYISGSLEVQSNTYLRRPGYPTHGLLYFGSASTDYILMDAVSWTFGGGKNVYANDFISTSDREKKTNIVYRESNIGIADHLRLADFEWKDSGLKSRGVIAQDVEEYLPQFVYENDGVKYVDKAGFTLELVSDLLRRVQRLEVTACL